MKYLYCEEYRDIFELFFNGQRISLDEPKRVLFKIKKDFEKLIKIQKSSRTYQNYEQIIIFPSFDIPVSVLCSDFNIQDITLSRLGHYLELKLKDKEVLYNKFINSKILEFESDDDAELWFEVGRL